MLTHGLVPFTGQEHFLVDLLGSVALNGTVSSVRAIEEISVRLKVATLRIFTELLLDAMLTCSSFSLSVVSYFFTY